MISINEVNPKVDWEEKKMDSDWKPDDSDIKTVLEAHGLLPEGPLLDETLGLTSLYADTIRQIIEKLPDSVNWKKLSWLSLKRITWRTV